MIRIFVLAPLAALTLAACTGSRVYNADISPAYSRSDLAITADKGPLPVAVVGNPFPQPASEVNRLLTAALPTYFAPGLSFVPTGPQEAPGGTRVVLLFRPGGPATRDEPCAMAASPAPVAFSDRLEVTATFCRGPSSLTAATGSLPAVTPVTAPEMADLMGYLANNLFPVRNPATDPRPGRPPFFLDGSIRGGSGGVVFTPGLGFRF